MNKNNYPDRLKNPQGQSMQKLRIKRQSNYIRSDTINLGHSVIRRPLIWSICKWKTRNRGNSKLLGRIVVIVFNVPFPYIYHFPNFSKSVEPCHLRVTTQFIKFEPVPIYLELTYSIWKISSVFDGNTWSKKFSKNTKLFFYIFWKVRTTNTLSLNSWVDETYISIRLENGYIPEEKHG